MPGLPVRAGGPPSPVQSGVAAVAANTEGPGSPRLLIHLQGPGSRARGSVRAGRAACGQAGVVCD